MGNPVGRPRKADKKLKVMISIDANVRELARLIGGGCVSVGIERALKDFHNVRDKDEH